MKKDLNAVYISLTGYSDTTLDLASYIGNQTKRVYLYGGLALDANLEILYTGVLKAHVLEIYSTANVVVSTYTYKVFGRKIPTLLATKRWAGFMLATATNTPQFYLTPDLSETGGLGIDHIDLSGALTNAMIKSDAGINFSKMEALEASRVPVIDTNGKIVASAITSTLLTALDGINANIQDQLDAKLGAGASALDDANIKADAAISTSKLAALTASRAMVTDATGKLAPSAITDAELAFLDGVDANIKTTLDAKIGTALTRGSILVGGATNLVTTLDANNDANILLGDGNDLKSVAVSGDLTMLNTGVTSIGADKVTASKVSADLRKEVIVAPFSFEANHVGAVAKVYIPYTCKLTYVHASVVKALAATESGYIQFANHAGTLVTGSNLTLGKMELVASTPQSSVVISTCDGNNDFTAGQVIQITCTKTTVGGNGLLTLVLTRA